MCDLDLTKLDLCIQVSGDIYLYTVKPIPPNVELVAWFSRDYADRINCPTIPPPLPVQPTSAPDSPPAAAGQTEKADMTRNSAERSDHSVHGKWLLFET
jgi:hypothetical protein